MLMTGTVTENGRAPAYEMGVIHLTGDSLEGLLESRLFSDKEKALIAEARKEIESDDGVAVYVWEAIVKPKFAESDGLSDEFLDEWLDLEVRLKSFVPECYHGAYDKCVEIKSAVSGIRDGIRVTQEKIREEALSLLKKMEEGDKETRETILALGKYEVNPALTEEQRKEVLKLQTLAMRALHLTKDLEEENKRLETVFAEVGK